MPIFRCRPSSWDDSTPDEELVWLAQHGQYEAFGSIFDRYLTRVYGYCFRMLGEREAAQDANSIVFTKAFAALINYRPDRGPGSFRSWLFAIAHNVVADELRARRGTESLDAVEMVLDQAPSPEDRVIAADEWQTVLALLPRLSADQGHVIALRLSGLTVVEISQILGRPRNAIDGIHHRALVRLRELVATGAEPAVIGGRGRD